MSAPLSERDRLQEAMVLLSAQRGRLGGAAVETIVGVLGEHLARLDTELRDRSALSSEARPPLEQRKQVTVLFAAIDGFTRLAGAAHNTERLRQIDLLWRRLDETIHYHGGIVDKHMGDVIMGIFGVPSARENDPERAVRCAMAVREMVGEALVAAAAENALPPDAQLVIRIGINTGLAALGQLGSDDGQTVIGDAVNVASRLKEAAPGPGVYISQDTYRLVRDLFRVEALGQVAVKGRQMPVTVYRVVGSQPRVFFAGAEGLEGVTVPMIGRAAEMATLQDALRQTAQTGRGRLITILGEAGVGKSRLAREFNRWLESFPAKAVRFQGRTDQRWQEVPHSLWRDVVIDHFGIEESDRAGTIEEKIGRALAGALSRGAREEALGVGAGGQGSVGRGMRERARAIARLVGLGEGEDAALDLAVAPSRHPPAAARAADLLLDYFVAVAGRSAVTLFFLEDIHWADDDSLALLERLAERAAETPTLILCLARPLLMERRPGWPAIGGRPPGAPLPGSQLPLEPLTEADSRELVLHILRKLPQIPPSLSDLIVRSAAGNPFYVEELVRVLIEDGVIVPGDTAWQLRARELTRLRVPTTLTGVLQARLDRLPELERVTLQQAAVIGDEFWAEAVQQLNGAARAPFAPEQVTAALLALERRDMIYRAPSPVFGGQAYLFKHAVLREVAYESVLLRDRPGYHLAAARWLRAQSGDRLPEYAAPIAQHHEAAGQPADAARLYELAAGRAAELYKPGVAVELYRRALALLRDLPHFLDARLDVQDRLGRVLEQQGRLTEALYVYHAMQRVAELDGNLLGQARAENSLAGVLFLLGDPAGARAAADRAEPLARLTGADIEWVRALRWRAEAAAAVGQTAEAAAAALAAVERSRALDAPRELAWSLSLAGAMAAGDAATQALDELAALAGALEGRGAIDDAATALTRLGAARLRRGDDDAATAALDRALALRRAAGDLAGAAETLRLLGLAVLRARPSPPGRGPSPADAPSPRPSHGGGDPIPAQQGRGPAAAIAYLEEAGALAEATGRRYERLRSRLALAEALADDRPEAAEALLRGVIVAAEDLQRMGTWRHLPEAKALLGRVLRRQGRGDEVGR